MGLISNTISQFQILNTQTKIYIFNKFQYVRRMNSWKALLFMCIGTAVTTKSTAQDPHFTQYYASPLYMNPAAAGSAMHDGAAAARTIAQYRNQWSGLPGNFNTLNLGWDQAFDFAHGGFGVQYTSDAIASGLITSSTLSATYSYAAQISSQYQLRIGLQTSVVNRNLNVDKLRFADQLNPMYQLDPSNPSVAASVRYPSFGTGFLLQSEQLYLGIVLFNVNQPNWSFYQNPDEVQPRRLAIHCGYTFQLNKNINLTPQGQFMKQGNFTEALLGSNLQFKNVNAGLWYRQTFGQYMNADAIAASIGYQLKRFRMLYSYDATISDGRSAIPSSHEISLQFCWNTKQGIKK